MKTYNVLSYGESLAWWFNYEKPKSEDFTTIGVNHIGHYTNVDLLLLIDHPAHFTPQKIDTIVNRTHPDKFLIANDAWLAYILNHKCISIEFAEDRSSLKTIEHPEPLKKLPFSYNSPFVAACIAMRSGAKRINLFGVDFNTDSAAGSDLEPKNIRDWQKLYLTAHALGVQIYTCPESKLKKFIPINPDLNTQI